MSKKPTIKDLEQKIAELTKKIESAESYAEVYRKASSRDSAILNEAHAIIDALPGAPPRKIPDKQYEENSLGVRLIGWLANRVVK